MEDYFPRTWNGNSLVSDCTFASYLTAVPPLGAPSATHGEINLEAQKHVSGCYLVGTPFNGCKFQGFPKIYIRTTIHDYMNMDHRLPALACDERRWPANVSILLLLYLFFFQSWWVIHPAGIWPCPPILSLYPPWRLFFVSSSSPPSRLSPPAPLPGRPSTLHLGMEFIDLTRQEAIYTSESKTHQPPGCVWTVIPIRCPHFLPLVRRNTIMERFPQTPDPPGPQLGWSSSAEPGVSLANR